MTVLAAYVPDDTGLRAVRAAADQAGWRGTDVVIVNVLGPAGFATPTAADEKNLDAIADVLAGTGVPFAVRQVALGSQSVSDVLLAVAAETDADLIVLGLKRTSQLAKAILGSTVQRVLADASCPVLCLRAT